MCGGRRGAGGLEPGVRGHRLDDGLGCILGVGTRIRPGHPGASTGQGARRSWVGGFTVAAEGRHRSLAPWIVTG